MNSFQRYDHTFTREEISGIKEAEEIDLFSWWNEVSETTNQQSTSSSTSSQFSINSVNSGTDELEWLGHCEEEDLSLFRVESIFDSTTSDKKPEETTTHPGVEGQPNEVHKSKRVFQADTYNNIKPRVLLQIDIVTEKKDR